jgi:hypothetical protein
MLTRSVGERRWGAAAQDLYGYADGGTGGWLFHPYDFTFVGYGCSRSNPNNDVDLTVQFGLYIAEEENPVPADIANKSSVMLAVSAE